MSLRYASPRGLGSRECGRAGAAGFRRAAETGGLRAAGDRVLRTPRRQHRARHDGQRLALRLSRARDRFPRPGSPSSARPSVSAPDQVVVVGSWGRERALARECVRSVASRRQRVRSLLDRRVFLGEGTASARACCGGVRGLTIPASSWVRADTVERDEIVAAQDALRA
jgi:hypothetical protein